MVTIESADNGYIITDGYSKIDCGLVLFLEKNHILKSFKLVRTKAQL